MALASNPFEAHKEKRKLYLDWYISKNYELLDKVFWKSWIEYIASMNFLITSKVEAGLPQKLKEVEENCPYLKTLYIKNQKEYLNWRTRTLITEDMNVPENIEYINAISLPIEEVISIAQIREKSKEYSWVEYLYKVLKFKRLTQKDPNKWRTSRKPLISICPVGKAVFEHIKSAKESMI